MGTRVSFPGVKRPGREVDHSPPSSVEVKEWVVIPPFPQYVFVVWCSVKSRGTTLTGHSTPRVLETADIKDRHLNHLTASNHSFSILPFRFVPNPEVCGKRSSPVSGMSRVWIAFGNQSSWLRRFVAFLGCFDTTGQNRFLSFPPQWSTIVAL
jgi:hypothetical protein